MKTCPRCGQSVPADANICSNCYFNFANAQPNQTTPGVDPNANAGFNNSNQGDVDAFGNPINSNPQANQQSPQNNVDAWGNPINNQPQNANFQPGANNQAGFTGSDQNQQVDAWGNPIHGKITANAGLTASSEVDSSMVNVGASHNISDSFRHYLHWLKLTLKHPYQLVLTTSHFGWFSLILMTILSIFTIMTMPWDKGNLGGSIITSLFVSVVWLLQLVVVMLTRMIFYRDQSGVPFLTRYMNYANWILILDALFFFSNLLHLTVLSLIWYALILQVDGLAILMVLMDLNSVLPKTRLDRFFVIMIYYGVVIAVTVIIVFAVIASFMSILAGALAGAGAAQSSAGSSWSSIFGSGSTGSSGAGAASSSSYSFNGSTILFLNFMKML